MKPETFEKIKNNLLYERQQLLSKKYIAGDVDSSGDEFDKVQSNLILAMNESLSQRDFARLNAINTALIKIEKCEFGKCEECEVQISEKRLLFNPAVILCLSCAEDQEMEEKKNRNRVK